MAIKLVTIDIWVRTWLASAFIASLFVWRVALVYAVKSSLIMVEETQFIALT